jgi:hypothetical protein
MWLLDPSWEHATADKTMEKSLKKFRADLFDPAESEKLEQGRIDIEYRTAAGTHMIVELKRYSYKAKLADLDYQGGKYWNALHDVLERTGSKSEQIDVIFVLGQKPDFGALGRSTEDERVKDVLGHIRGRVLYYDTMLADAKRQYVSYQESLDKNDSLASLLASLDAGSALDDESTEASGDVVLASPPELDAITKAVIPSPALFRDLRKGKHGAPAPIQFQSGLSGGL